MGIDGSLHLAATISEVVAFYLAERGDGIVWFYHREFASPESRGNAVADGGMSLRCPMPSSSQQHDRAWERTSRRVLAAALALGLGCSTSSLSDQASEVRGACRSRSASSWRTALRETRSECPVGSPSRCERD